MNNIVLLLHANNYLSLNDLLQCTSACKSLSSALATIWEHLLMRHFPSCYLVRENSFTTVTNWKYEYYSASKGLSIRYFDGTNLHQSKVLHFGPTLDAGIIKELLNKRSNYIMAQNYVTQMSLNISTYRVYCYENKIFCFTFSPRGEVIPAMLNLDQKDIAPRGKLKTCPSVVSDGFIYCYGEFTKLICYKIATPLYLKAWETPIFISVFNELVVHTKKIFFLDKDGILTCLSATTGQQEFIINPLPSLSLKRSGVGPQIVFDGDFVIWCACHEPISIAVANWKTQQTLPLVNLTKLLIEKRIYSSSMVLSRFTVRDGIMYVHLHKESFILGSSHFIAIKLCYSREEDVSIFWDYTTTDGRIEGISLLGPCLYEHTVLLAVKQVPAKNTANLWICALDALSGKLKWRVTFQYGSTSKDSNSALRVHDFFVIEGVATIQDRRRLKEKFKGTQEIQDNESYKVRYLEDGVKETTVTGNFDSGATTTHATLRCTVALKGGFATCAVIVETGEVLFFNHSPANVYTAFSTAVMVTKCSKPEFFSMSP